MIKVAREKKIIAHKNPTQKLPLLPEKLIDTLLVDKQKSNLDNS